MIFCYQLKRVLLHLLGRPVSHACMAHCHVVITIGSLAVRPTLKVLGALFRLAIEFTWDLSLNFIALHVFLTLKQTIDTYFRLIFHEGHGMVDKSYRF